MSDPINSSSSTSRTCSVREEEDEKRPAGDELLQRAKHVVNQLLGSSYVDERGPMDPRTRSAIDQAKREMGADVDTPLDEATVQYMEGKVRARTPQEPSHLVESVRSSIGEAVGNGRKAIGKALSDAGRAAYAGMKAAMPALDLERQTAGLGVGESYEIKAKATVRVEVGASEAAAVKMTHNADDTYTLEMSADVAAVVGVNVGVGVEGSLSVGSKLTFVAKNKAEAMKMADIATRASIEVASAGAAGYLRAAGAPLTSTEELGFMTDHCTAITLRGANGLKVSGETGQNTSAASCLGSGQTSVGAEASISGELQESVTMKVDHGVVKEVLFEADLKVLGEQRAAAGARNNQKEFKVSSPMTSISLSGSEECHIKATRHASVPPGMTVTQFLKSGGTAATLGTTDLELSFEGKVEMNAFVAGFGGGIRGKVTLTNLGTPKEVARIAGAMKGMDVSEAARNLPKGSQMQVRLATLSVDKDMEIAPPNVDKAGVKIAGKLQASHVRELHVYQDAGTPSEVLGRRWAPKATAPKEQKHAQLDTNVQDQRYARVAG